MNVNYKTLIAAAALSVGLLGCDSPVKIGDVERNPGAFEGKEVRLQGIAGQTVKIPLVEVKAYRLKDATGEVQVIAASDLPKEGDEVVVRGRVESVAIVAGQSFGLTVKEIERRPPGIRWPWQ